MKKRRREKGREEEEEEEEKGMETRILYGNYFCIKLVNFCMDLYGFLGLDLVP